ncbi:NADPH-dependent F420 reductase [Glycomyces buryatensis]|uniref:Oxidoreductase n=1 Tax=Glycomyces buryatensis TaxID=2570927 RepID=A0A4V4HQQ4_9ACTN|nr:NAD(P)-binding domain-containing protein [Glycomyces buryatensis]THV34686.1 oxidoreductase [Glycomyces buryatensis]
MPGTIGFIGSGMIGTAVARLAIAEGFEVVLSNSRGPETLTDLVADLGAQARAATPAEAAVGADLVVAAVPLSAFDRLPVEALEGKTVLDTSNYYPQRDGHLAELDAGELTSSELLQRHLAGARVVKAFNNIAFSHIVSLARPAGADDRSALPISGDDAAAKAEADRLLDALGWDTVDAGTLAESWRSAPETPVYVKPYLEEMPAEGVADFLTWVGQTSGTPVPAAEVAKLIEAAVRLPAGDTRLPNPAD